VRAIGILILGITTLVATVTHGAAESPAPSLATRAARFPALRTATADFAQERDVSLVDEVLHAQGTLTLAAPASFRLDLTAPESMALIAAGPAITVVDAEGKSLPLPPEVAGLAAFARILTDLLLGARSPEGFSEDWRDPNTVVLRPQQEGTSPFTEITLRFPASGPLPEEIVMRERGGDRTTIRLHSIALNPPLDPARFRTPSAAEGS
jgi:outer membrane lipoprotein-sorting protein